MINPAASSEKVRKVRRRRRRLRRRLRRGAGIFFLLAVVVLVAGALLRKDPKPAAAPPSTAAITFSRPSQDVKIDGPCSYDNFAASAPVTIKNGGGETFNYVVRVTFLDAGKLYTAAVVTQDNLHAGETVHLKASAVTSRGNPTKLTCFITDIRRFND